MLDFLSHVGIALHAQTCQQVNRSLIGFTKRMGWTLRYSNDNSFHDSSFTQCASELSRKLLRGFNRLFTPSNRSHTSSPNDNSNRHLTHFLSLLRSSDGKAHAHRCRSMFTHQRNQIAKSCCQRYAFSSDTCHSNKIDKALGVA